MSNRELYLDYVNNFLTVDAFASHHNMTREQAVSLIKNEGVKDLTDRIEDLKTNPN